MPNHILKVTAALEGAVTSKREGFRNIIKAQQFLLLYLDPNKDDGCILVAKLMKISGTTKPYFQPSAMTIYNDRPYFGTSQIMLNSKIELYLKRIKKKNNSSVCLQSFKEYSKDY